MKNKDLDWRIWNKNDLVEERTYLGDWKTSRNGERKQLGHIIRNIDKNETVLDVGCAAGHYLRSIRQLSVDCKYTERCNKIY